MAKLTLTDLTNLANEQSVVSTINANNALIETALEGTLSRDGTSPNTMSADLDMNSNNILNLPEAVSDTEPVRKAEFDEAIEELTAAGIALPETGLVAYNQSTGTATARTLTGPAAGITVSNGTGADGNPTLALANDLAALEALSGTNTIYYRSGTDTWSAVTIGSGLSFSAGTLSGNTDAELLALAGLTSAADKLPYFTGSGTAAVTDFTSFARTLVDDANATAARSTLGLVIGTDVQAQDAELAALAGLTSAADKLPYFTGSGTAALADFTSFGRSLVDDANAGAARTTLGLVIGTDVQAQDAELAALAGLTSAADKLPYFTGSGTAAVADFSSYGRSLVDDADAGTALTTLGVSAFAQTILDDANQGAARTTLGVGTGDSPTFTAITVGDAGLTVGASAPFSDSAGTLTLQNVDALDATTEATVEAAIDTLANLVSIQGRTVTLADAGFDVLLGWDDSAGAYKNFALADMTAEGAPATGDYVLIYGAEGDLRKVDWSDLPGAGGGLTNISEDTDPALGGDLDGNTFDILFDDNTGIRDDSDNEHLIFQKTATAVNHWEMTNAATGDAPLLQAVGGDTDVAARLSSKGAGSVHLAIDGTNEVTLTSSALSPAANDGNALGTTALGWADLHLATGGVINWANGEVTLTETDANTLTLAGASTFDVGSAAILRSAKEPIWIPALACKARTTSGAGTSTYDSGSNDVTITTFDFDTTSQEYIHTLPIGMPKAWNESTVTAVIYWTNTGGASTETVRWTVAGLAMSDDDTLNGTFGTAVNIDDTWLAQNDTHITSESGAITIGGTPAESDLVIFQISRDVANDNMAGDAKFIGMKLFITTTTSTDA